MSKTDQTTIPASSPYIDCAMSAYQDLFDEGHLTCDIGIRNVELDGEGGYYLPVILHVRSEDALPEGEMGDVPLGKVPNVLIQIKGGCLWSVATDGAAINVDRLDWGDVDAGEPFDGLTDPDEIDAKVAADYPMGVW